MAENSPLKSLMAKLEERIRFVEDIVVPEEDRFGLDCIRGDEDLTLCMKFITEVSH